MDSSLKRNIFTAEKWEKFLEEGRVEFYELYQLPLPKYYTREDFDFIKTIGTGAFGRVYLAASCKTGKYFAIKVLLKSEVVKLKQVTHTLVEKSILQAINIPFCVYLEMAFKDNSCLYMCLPFISGGEMFKHLRESKRFEEPLSKFYGAQVLLALEYLHYLDIVYRDLKPENLLIDERGYIKLTDFGLCKILKGRTYSICGTPEYIAPEILLHKGYGKAADWWSYGVLLYEMTAGFPPFQAPDSMKIFEKITTGKYRTPSFFSSKLVDLLFHLFQVNLSERYGNLVSGIKDIKYHSWYNEINWQALFHGDVPSPFIPNVSGPGDDSNFMPYDEITMVIASKNMYATEFESF